MTHSLHRLGTRENLANDFSIYLYAARDINEKGSQPKQAHFLEIGLRNNAVNGGKVDVGNFATESPQEVIARARASTGLSCTKVVCTNKKDVINILRETIEADTGLSIVVQGIFEEVEECLAHLGIKPHTVNHSLGIWGTTEKLPSTDILEITTMCGHGLISTSLVKKCITDVVLGSMTSMEAAQLLARPCVCGLFNPVRAQMLIERIASKIKL